MAGLALVTPPAQEPVSIGDAKDHLRVTGTDDEDLITSLITAARKDLERRTGRVFITQTWDYTIDVFPAGRELQLPRPPLQSITSVKYTPDGGSQATFAASSYVVDVTSDEGRVVLERASDWPGDTLGPANGIVIRFIAGYGDDVDVPEPIRQALLVHIGTLYEHREDILTGTILTPIRTVANLIAPYQLQLVA